MDINKLKTMKAVAAEFGLTKARICQLCSEAGVQGLFVGNQKMLTPSDVKALRSVKRGKYTKSNQ